MRTSADIQIIHLHMVLCDNVRVFTKEGGNKEKRNAMYEFIGKVKAVGELQTFASGFSKRELIVEVEREGNWPNVVAFAFKKEHAAKLEGLAPGMRVKIGFAVDGREWTDPKTGKVRYFSDLTALRLERLDASAQVPAPAVPDDVASELDDDSGIPF